LAETPGTSALPGYEYLSPTKGLCLPTGVETKAQIDHSPRA